MYLHIGKDILIKEEKMIGMFRLETIKETEEYRQMEKKLKEENKLMENQEEKNTFILTEEKGYLTNISVTTLEKRAKSNII